MASGAMRVSSSRANRSTAARLGRDRPAIVVKIDNGSAAAPHTGLNAADIVVEEVINDSATRLAARR